MQQKFEPVGDIRGRDFAAWLGLVPRQYSTGGKSILGRSQNGAAPISGRFLSVILMRPKNWDRFSFGSWLKAGAIRLHKNKLAITLAIKLARIAWSVLRHCTQFDNRLSRNHPAKAPVCSIEENSNARGIVVFLGVFRVHEFYNPVTWRQVMPHAK
jgi:hypothetical protein